LLACLLVPVVLVGCAKGPAWRLGALSPWVQQKWAEEEKQYGATLYTKLADVEALAARATSMDAAERDRWSQQFAQLATSDPSPLLRARIVAALPAFPSPAADAALQAALDDKDLDVRCAACEAWGRRGGSQALQLLSTKLAIDEELDVRLAAIRALGRLDQQPTSAAAVRALGVALDDKNPAVQFVAIESLRNVSGRDYGTDLVAWRDFAAGGQPPEPTPTIAERLRSWF
jgi:HEAT repeat protein